MDGSFAPRGQVFYKRAVTRRACHLRALLHTSDKSYSCVIRDFSPLGCQIALDEARMVWGRVRVELIQKRLIFRGMVVWTKEKALGVKFDPIRTQQLRI